MTGRFMADFARTGTANWNDPRTEAINRFGILGTGTATIHGRTVRDVKPVLQKDGSGFYVSPTALADNPVTDPADQSRYVNPLRVPAAVAPGIGAQDGMTRPERIEIWPGGTERAVRMPQPVAELEEPHAVLGR